MSSENLPRRLLTMRAFNRINRELGTAGVTCARCAVAVAAAVHPDAIVQHEEWDQLNQNLPKPALTPADAGKVVEEWLEHGHLDWSACLARLYACDPAQLIRTLIRGAATHVDSAKAGSQLVVQPCLAGRVPEAGDAPADSGRASREKLDRLVEVMTAICGVPIRCPREAQIDLTEAAIGWALATLALHKDRGRCEEHLYALADAVHLAEPDQVEDLSNGACDPSARIHHSFADELNDITRASAEIVRRYEQFFHPPTAATTLQHVRRSQLEHIAPFRLARLIAGCVKLSQAIGDIGVRPEALTSVSENTSFVISTAVEIPLSILSAIETEKLTVERGVLVNPARGTHPWVW
ncbi:hypothetical protein [Candidatus Laterigemmans baculatus]|uniref:hypothetical protein n=1 Tax=Candidatus Laterigemmans baculatus TaxID=2770505 RepID=UPI0013DD653B|nr:hypothetical protein [Candidatus Laterigemmans baculatus]